MNKTYMFMLRKFNANNHACISYCHCNGRKRKCFKQTGPTIFTTLFNDNISLRVLLGFLEMCINKDVDK